MVELELYDCPNCKTKGVLKTSDDKCPNCRSDLTSIPPSADNTSTMDIHSNSQIRAESSEEDQASYGGFPFSVFTGGLIEGLGTGLPADMDRDGILYSDEWLTYAAGRIPPLYDQDPVYWAAPGLERVAIVAPEPTTMLLLSLGFLVLRSKSRNHVGRTQKWLLRPGMTLKGGEYGAILLEFFGLQIV
jgi:hypothetical protein